MRKILTLIIIALIVSACGATNYKNNLAEVYPAYAEDINEILTNDDAKLCYDIYQENSTLSFLELCEKMVLESNNTPSLTKNSLNYLKKEYNLTNVVFTRLEDSNLPVLFYDIYSSGKDTKVNLMYFYNDISKTFDKMIVALDHEDVTEKSSMQFYFVCLEAMMSVDASFENNVQLANDIVGEAFDREQSHNGFTYSVVESDSSVGFVISK